MSGLIARETGASTALFASFVASLEHIYILVSCGVTSAVELRPRRVIGVDIAHQNASPRCPSLLAQSPEVGVHAHTQFTLPTTSGPAPFRDVPCERGLIAYRTEPYRTVPRYCSVCERSISPNVVPFLQYRTHFRCRNFPTLG